MRFLLLLVPLLCCAQKPQGLLSPGGDRIAYIEQCQTGEGCTPAIVILGLDGRRVTSFPAPRGDIMSIAWTSDRAVAAVCHINPSLSEYFETDIATGEITRNFLGYDFTPAPDGSVVAHAGWIVHFAPPYVQSDYLQIDDVLIYPLPAGTRPVALKRLEHPPTVVRKQGLTWSGIHQFMPGLAWSPDSRSIALLDCTYDWTTEYEGALSAGYGQESNRQCFVAVVSRAGEAKTIPLDGVTRQGLNQPRLSWIDARTLELHAKWFDRTLVIP